MLLRPPYLRAGDIIVILSTARRVTIEEITPAIGLFESWGLKVRLGKTIGLVHHQFAGTDAEREADLQAAVSDPDVRAIICARGGYGSVRMMDNIDWTGLLTHPKWFCGFSDMTYIHVHLNQTLGVQTLHSTVPVFFPKNTPGAIETLRKQLFGEEVVFSFPANPLNRKGATKGVMIGGNLSILYSITGTKSGFNTAGKILYLEDIDEYLYHVDRMMMNLKRSGKLHDLAGLVVGGLTDMKDNTIPFGMTAEEIIREHVERYDFPVCFDFPAGHIADNNTIVLGKMTRMEVGENNVTVR
ncbi:MAG: LD-carboxypeptidase [Bacteroidetes bacterium]|nr:LD-carboxypeptidase [Bacteroidota bacterium]